MDRRVPREVWLAALVIALLRAFEAPVLLGDACLLVCHGTGEVKGVRALLSADRAEKGQEIGDGREDAT